MMSDAKSPLDSRFPTLGYLGSSTVMEQPWQAGLIDAAREQAVNLIIFAGGALADPHRFDTQRSRIFALAGPTCVDGLIIGSDFLGHYVGPERIGEFCARYRPLPIVKYEPLVEGYPTLLFDFYQGMYDLITHLVEVHGLRKIAYVTGPEQSPSIGDRLRAYRDALAAHAIAYDPTLVVGGSHGIPAGADAVRILLEERRLRPQVDVQAIVAFYDPIAADIVRALQARAIAVPQAIAVAGFDDDDAALTVKPRLTTVRLPFYECGRWGVETLAGILRGEEAPAITVLPAALVTRRSCGCHAQRYDPLRLDPLRPSGTGPGPARTPLLARMLHAAGVSGIPRYRKELLALLDLFLAHMDGGGAASDGAGGVTFTRDLARLIDAMPGIYYNIDLPYAILAALAQELSAASSDDARLRQSRHLLQAAQAVISDRLQRFLVSEKHTAAHLDGLLLDLNQALATAVTVEDLVDVLALHLPRLGVAACYLARYEDPGDVAGAANLLLAWGPQGRVSLPAGGRRYPAKQLIPPGMWDPPEPAALVVLPLFHRREQMGFVALQVGPRYGGLYEGIREQISTALKRIELHQGLVAARRQAEEANALKSRFLATVTHELRAPLSTLVNLSTSLLEEAGAQGQDTDRQRDLQLIRAIGQHLDRLVLDVLDLGRSQSGQLALDLRPIDLHALLQTVAATGAQMAQAKGLRWRAHVPPYLPPVRADTTRLQQILLNLLDNAMKFTLHGEVTLLAAAQQREVLLAVSDTGLGIPQADQSIIFDEFRQSERTSARGYGGMGLGLAITRRLVELHGGAMGLISSGEEGRGATFYFTLPIAEAEAPQGVPAARPQAGEHADTDAVAVANVLAGTGFHETGSMRAATAILLIDDEVAALRVQAELIRRRLPEARVYEAAGGRQALDLMQRVTPDLVLLDLAMPDMDGFAVLNAMAEQAALHAVPVVIMTANPPDDAAIQQLTPHVAAIVSKGLLAADETLATIQRALASKSRSPDAQRIARRCLAYIHRHYARPLTRGELAQHSGVNARYLTYCFHQEIGMPPFEYLNRYRVLVAKRLLREGRGRIGDVALAAGFGGAPQFSRMFRKYTGMSPRAYAHTPQDR